MQGGCGQPCTLQLDPRLFANDGAVLHESTHLLRAYVAAITEGAVQLELRIVRGCGPMPFTVLPDASGCGLVHPSDAFGQVCWFGYRFEKQAGSFELHVHQLMPLSVSRNHRALCKSTSDCLRAAVPKRLRMLVSPPHCSSCILAEARAKRAPVRDGRC